MITRLMAYKLTHPEFLSLAAGFTDNRVLPEDLVRQAMELGATRAEVKEVVLNLMVVR